MLMCIRKSIRYVTKMRIEKQRKPRKTKKLMKSVTESREKFSVSKIRLGCD